MEERTLIDAASVTYNSPDDRWFASLYGKNLLNEEYRVSANSGGRLVELQPIRRSPCNGVLSLASFSVTKRASINNTVGGSS